MFSKPKDNVYHSRSVPAAGWKVSTLIILVIIIVFLISLLIAYYLGLRAGKNSGLELAHENSLAQVMRMPVSKAVFDKLAEEGAKESASDIYQELSKTKQDNNAPKQKIEEVSQQVKEILKPTATAAQVAKVVATEVVAAEATAVQLAKGKQENVDAIRQALEQVNPQAIIPADKKDPAVRVINPSGNNPSVNEDSQAETKKSPEKNEQDLNRQEKFALQEEKEVIPTVKAKPTIKATSTPLAKKTATPAAVVTGATKKLESGWYAQVAAPKSLKEAQAIAGNLKKAGLKAEIESAEVGDQQYFRVVVGPSNSRLAAEQNLSRLRKQSSLKAEPFVRLVR